MVAFWRRVFVSCISCVENKFPSIFSSSNSIPSRFFLLSNTGMATAIM